MKDIIFFSDNWYKTKLVEEMAGERGIGIRPFQKKLIIYEELTLRENVERNMEELYDRFRQPLMIAKTGLFIEGFDNFPGVNTKWISQVLGTKGISRLIDKGDAMITAIVGFKDKSGQVIEEYHIKGHLDFSSDADSWFFDSFFIPEGYSFPLGKIDEKERARMWRKPFNMVFDKIRWK